MSSSSLISTSHMDRPACSICFRENDESDVPLVQANHTTTTAVSCHVLCCVPCWQSWIGQCGGVTATCPFCRAELSPQFVLSFKPLHLQHSSLLLRDPRQITDLASLDPDTQARYLEQLAWLDVLEPLEQRPQESLGSQQPAETTTIVHTWVLESSYPGGGGGGGDLTPLLLGYSPDRSSSFSSSSNNHHIQRSTRQGRRCF